MADLHIKITKNLKGYELQMTEAGVNGEELERTSALYDIIDILVAHCAIQKLDFPQLKENLLGILSGKYNRWVVFNKSEADLFYGAGFWNNEMGWCRIEQATIFYTENEAHPELDPCLFSEWITLQRAWEICRQENWIMGNKEGGEL